jgi:hypothetical protein
MPKELLRVTSGICWRRTVIRPRSTGPETEVCFEVEGVPFSVAFNSIPDRAFLHGLAELRCIAVYEFSSEERGWVEPGRYQVRINDDDDIDDEAVLADYVRWGPVDSS